MKISILLPYKENYSMEYAGAVSIFVNGVNRFSKFNQNIKVYGNTDYPKKLSENYVNIPFKKKYFQSSTKVYVNNFISLEKKRNSDIIEIHNRPSYLRYFSYFKKKIVFYFHNDPLSMNGSTSIKDRNFILDTCNKIIFNSEWTKNRFFKDLDKFYINSEKIEVIYQSTSRKKINLNKKEKIIIFVGKLNKSKGYDLFGKAIIKILNEFKDWKTIVFGDEPREKINFYHERLINMGYQSNNNVLKNFNKSSIAVACSKWDEPFGRASLEASSRGCAVIISNKGGLPETITDGIILKKLNSISIYNEIKNLILNKKKLFKLQKNSLENFYLDNRYSSSLIDIYRSKLFVNSINKKKKLKILHVTNFNLRHNGRLFYNTGRRINNGLLKLGHTVQSLSDRDTISQERKIMDIYGSKSLNQKLLEIVGNFTPDLIIIGHADQISIDTLYLIKKFYPSIYISQWFLDKMDDNNWLSNKKRFINKLECLDASFCTTHPSSLKLSMNKKIFFIPNPVDDTFENLKIYSNKFYKYDLFFALSHGVHRGTLKKGKNDNREFFLRNLINKNSEIRFNILGINNNQPIWAENFRRELSKSKMALNLSQGVPLKFYSSDRLAQLVGNGILTFVDIQTKLSKLFSNKEVVFYKNINDLSKKINFYKNSHNVRDRIARNGMKKYHKFMNSTLVASYIINKTLNINKNQKYFWENK
tara:strand:- start:1247 stop:3352 length:2106 start_codon:yes stop_codon:yes gene_type:complete